MSRGFYWRFALILPPFVVVAVVIVASFVSEPFPPEGILARVEKITGRVVYGPLVAGIWPAYAIWAAIYLWFTRRLSGERFRATCWIAPITFAPVPAIAMYISSLLRETNSSFPIDGVALVVGGSLMLGFLSIGLALVLEALFRQIGWIAGPAERSVAA